MKLFPSKSKNTVLSVLITSLIVFFASCTDRGKPAERVQIEILFCKLPSSFIEESNKLSEEARALLSGLEGNKEKCDHNFILDPVLRRVDLNIDTSIVTTIEKSRIAGATAIRDFKINNDHLKEIVVPSRMLKVATQNKDSLFNIAITSDKIEQDSIIIFASTPTTDSTKIGSKKYTHYNDVKDIRLKMLSILCQNPKARITLLIDPPKASTPLPAPPSTTVTSPISNTVVNGPSKPVGGPSPRRVVSYRDRGDLTIIKGSEGCDICTRYYSATDNLGHVRQVTQKNSTECCPCGKTIEMQGRTYRMECDGNGGNRLALIE